MPAGEDWSLRSRYKPETAGHLAVHRVPHASCGETVATVCRRLRADGYEAIDLILVVNDDGSYRGAVALKSLLEADDAQPIDSLINATWPKTTPETDQEHAVECATTAGVSVLPVVSEDGRPLGVIKPVVLLEVLAREHFEDVNRFVGILKDRVDARQALEDPPLRRVARRLPWLLIGLALSTSATAIMTSYESVLRADVLVAVFIPALVYLSDAVGTQTEAIAVRGLSLRNRPLAHVLGSEIVTGAIIGLILGLISIVGIWIVFGNFRAGLGVGISLFAAGSLASAIGLLLPWALSRFGIDPAFGSGPVATIFQDTLTIIVYFVVMTSLLPI